MQQGHAGVLLLHQNARSCLRRAGSRGLAAVSRYGCMCPLTRTERSLWRRAGVAGAHAGSAALSACRAARR
jgi:hypothetical protein